MTLKERAERYARIIDLRRRGWQLKEIAEVVGLSRVSVHNILKEAKEAGDLPTHLRIKVPEGQSMLRGEEPANVIDVRTWLASAALSGLLADRETRRGAAPSAVADLAVTYADALIARLNGATNATPSRLLERPGEDGSPFYD